MTNSEPAPVETGLTHVEAAKRLLVHGSNSVPEPKPRSLVGRIGQQLRDPMIMLLLGAAALTAALRDYTDLAVIGLVIVLNTAVGVAQEVRAEHAIAALRKLAAPMARVRRDGRELPLPAAELVPGDIVLLEAGDVVPADLRLLHSVHVQADESALTGESLPVDKDAASDVLNAGTIVTRGRGTGVVTATGTKSALGRIAQLLSTQTSRPTPLQRRLAGLGRILTAGVLAIGMVVIVLGMIRGESLATMLIVAVSLAVAAVPESMPAVVVLALALGAHRMATRAAVVRQLPAVETLGSVTIVASDKTGTLTEGQMRAELVWTPQGTYHSEGPGYEPIGSVLDANGAPADSAALRRLVRDVVLCNDAQLHPPSEDDPRWRPLGDPQEAALLVLATRTGMSPDETRAHYPRRSEIPFDSGRKRMTTVHAADHDRLLVVCKGAPEVLLGTPGLLAPSAAVDHAEVANVAKDLAEKGYRVLAVADGMRAHGYVNGPEHGLQLIGLVGVVDPVRAGAKDLAATFENAGVRLVLITGDHPGTASEVATQVGLDHDRVLIGDELERTPRHELATASVFARTHPEQKLELVRAWQVEGHVVAMTGDGVNDGPALKQADIGVAMGAGGTEVARQAADLVLADDNLATVTVAIEEGRRIYANVRRFLGYAIGGGVAEVLVMLTGPLVGVALPLLPSQILWVNLLTHGLPGVAMGAEPAEPGAMTQPPRPPNESVLGGGLWQQVLTIGAAIAAIVFLAAGLVGGRGGPWQSTAFVALGIGQLGVALALRARVRSAGHRRFLYVAVAGAAIAQVVPLYVPWLRTLLHLQPLAIGELGIAVLAGVLPGVAVEGVRRISRRCRGRLESTTADDLDRDADEVRTSGKPGTKG